MASINNWESKVLVVGIITLTADDEICDGIDTDCADSSTIRYPGWPESCNSFDYDCDSAADADDPTWGQHDDWSNYGEYTCDSDPTDFDEGFSQAQRLAWREGPLAALKIFVPLVMNEGQWERLVERFPALDDQWNWHGGSRFHRLVSVMDPPRYVIERLPMEGRRHYGAWKRWKGPKDPAFGDWIHELLEDESGKNHDEEYLFDILRQKFEEGFFDL